MTDGTLGTGRAASLTDIVVVRRTNSEQSTDRPRRRRRLARLPPDAGDRMGGPRPVPPPFDEETPAAPGIITPGYQAVVGDGSGLDERARAASEREGGEGRWWMASVWGPSGRLVGRTHRYDDRTTELQRRGAHLPGTVTSPKQALY